MNITKIKMKDGRITLHAHEGQEDFGPFKKVEFSSSDEPRPEFKAAFEGMLRPALTMLEAPLPWIDRGVVSSVTVKHEEVRGLGCVVTLLIGMDGLSHSPLVINTPYLVEDAGESGPTGEMPSALNNALVELIGEAERYLKGERAQADMFAGQKA